LLKTVGKEAKISLKTKNKVKAMYSELLRAKRYLVEQFNGHFKANLLKECYLRPKGIAKKTMVYAALISYATEALRALICDENSLKTKSKYRRLKPKILTDCVAHTFQTGKNKLKPRLTHNNT